MSDLSDFHDADDIRDMLPDTMTYTPSGYPHPSSKSRTVSCEVTKGFTDLQNNESYAPVAYVATADVTDAAHDAQIRHTDPVTGTTSDYYVKGGEPDGDGLTKLILEVQ